MVSGAEVEKAVSGADMEKADTAAVMENPGEKETGAGIMERAENLGGTIKTKTMNRKEVVKMGGTEAAEKVDNPVYSEAAAVREVKVRATLGGASSVTR